MLTLFGCTKSIPGEGPVKLIKVKSNYLIVELDTGVAIRDVFVDSEVFEGITPRTRTREYRALLGGRGNYNKVNDQTSYNEFITSHGKLRIYQEYAFEDGLHQWLELLPQERNVKKILIPQINAQLDFNDSSLERIYIYTADKKEFLTFEMANSHVTSFSWLDK